MCPVSLCMHTCMHTGHKNYNIPIANKSNPFGIPVTTLWFLDINSHQNTLLHENLSCWTFSGKQDGYWLIIYGMDSNGKTDFGVNVVVEGGIFRLHLHYLWFIFFLEIHKYILFLKLCQAGVQGVGHKRIELVHPDLTLQWMIKGIKRKRVKGILAVCSNKWSAVQVYLMLCMYACSNVRFN